MSVKIAYNNTPSLVLLCGNQVKLDPAGMAKDHAELTEAQQEDEAVKNMKAAGKIVLLSMDEAAKRESRRPKAAAPSEPLPKTSVTNPAAPPPAPEVKAEEPAPEPEKAPEKPAEKPETKPEPEPEAPKADEKDEEADDAKSKGKKGKKKSRRG